jgi:pilus assembly protein CpaE
LPPGASRRRRTLPANIVVVALGGADSERIAAPLIARGHRVTTLTDLADSTSALSQADLLIVTAEAAPAVVDGCRRLRNVAPAGLPIIALAHSHDVEERISLLEAGADDVLGEPLDARQLEALAEALLSRRQPTTGEPAAHPGAQMPAGGVGRVVCFGAAKGGAGTTLLAVNTAVLLAQRGQGIAIADLDFHHGQVAAHLDLRPTLNTAQLARDDQGQGSLPTVAEAALHHLSGLIVYAAPQRPDDGSMISVDDVIELVRTLRSSHPLTIIDAGSVPGSRALALLGLADISVLVVTPEIPGLRALSGTLAAMADAGVAGEQNLFVVNRTFAAKPIGRPDIEQNIGVKVALEIPFDGDNCMRSVNEGKPLVTLAPRSPVVAAIGRLAAMVTQGATAGTPAEAPRKRGGFLRRG